MSLISIRPVSILILFFCAYFLFNDTFSQVEVRIQVVELDIFGRSGRGEAQLVRGAGQGRGID